MGDIPSGDVPIPQPRVKKPVPRPRTNLCKTNGGDTTREGTKPKLTYTDSLRRSLKTVTENVQEKSTAVLESTKNVGAKIEKSFRGILSKRQTVVGIEDGLEVQNISEKERRNSLPSADVFNSITFGSPLISSSDPPSYPPPPLPDESVYDEPHSSKSSTTDSFYSVTSKPITLPEGDSFYEEIPRLKKLSFLGCSDDSDCSLSSEANLSQNKKDLKRSESWNFYDLPPAVPVHNYTNVTLEGTRIALNSVDNIYSTEPTIPNLRLDNYKIDRKDTAKDLSLNESCTSSKSVTNSLYENWSISSDSKDEKDERATSVASRSVIYEFDPLFCERDEPIVPKIQGTELDISLIPDPPVRVDSLGSYSQISRSADSVYLYENTNFPVEPEEIKIKSDIIQQIGKEEKKKPTVARWSSMKRAIKMVADGTPWTPLTVRKNQRGAKDEKCTVKRPPLSGLPTYLHSDRLFRSPTNGEKTKDFAPRWCQLSEGKLAISTEKGLAPKEVIPLESIVTIQHIGDRKYSVEGEEVYCWELRWAGKSTVLGCLSPNETRLWMHRVLEGLTSSFPSALSSHYSRAAWTYLKEGISGTWRGAWLLLEKRNLYYMRDKGSLKEVDLRKARCITLQTDDEGCKGTGETGPYVMVDWPDRALYLHFESTRETKDWQKAIKASATNNGSNLSDQQLTKDDIPVIVDKCINFVYAHGSMSEGIYRRSGSNSTVNKLLSELRRDAWAVQLSRQTYTEYDVASALKRFFRDLPHPLLCPTLYKYFCNAVGIKCSKEEKVCMYRHALEKLQPVSYVTTRRLIGHLHFIHQQANKNRMPVDNLAAIWGPTLMHVEGNNGVAGCGGMEWAKKECQVVGELVELYQEVFMVEGEEVAREERMREALQRATLALPPPRPSGDLHVWIGLGTNENCVNITVGPGYEAGQVCTEFCARMERGPQELCLTEVVLGGALSRPMHHSEHILDTVLRWSYWDQQDCKDNYLVITPNIVFRELIPLAKPPFSKCGELKYADPKSKSFKSYMFEFTQAKLSYYKDKTCSIKVADWRIEDIIWYIGHEPKRNPQSRWAITFINKNDKEKRCKESPYFGHTIAGSTKEEQLGWMAAMLLGQYQHTDLLPKHNLIE